MFDTHYKNFRYAFNLEFRYWLRGRTGDETVTISDGNSDRSVRLNVKPQYFIALRYNITIVFTNDAGSGSDVYFGSDVQSSITAPYYFEAWQCGLNVEEDKDTRCDRIRKGEFAWGGTYIVVFKGIEIRFLQLLSSSFQIMPLINRTGYVYF